MRKRISRKLPLGIAAIGMFMSMAVQSQQPAYPNKPIKLLLPVAAGGGTDILARQITQVLAPRLGQSIIVDNRGAATGIVGIEAVARSPADGYTIMFMTSAFTILPGLHRKLPYDPIKDFTPVIRLSTVPHVLVTNPSVTANSVQELVALSKRLPEELNYASQSPGTSSHLAAEMFKTATGTSITHVPYTGAAQAVTSLVSGQVSMMFSVPIVVDPHIRSGKLRLLAVTSAARSPLYPQTPTLRESGLRDFEALQWHGVWLPAGASPQLVNRINSEFAAAVGNPDVIKRMRAEGAEPIATTAQEFSSFVAAEITKWGEVIRVSGAKID